jgi:hypothetical protein
MILGTGHIGMGGVTTPSARLNLPAGTATAGTAPLKLTSGTLLAAPEVGTFEFLTDALYFTISTGAVRKTLQFSGDAVSTGSLTVTATGNMLLGKGIAGATGDYTSNTLTGRAKFAAAATSLTVTNSLVGANSIITATCASNDANAVYVKAAVAGVGSFVLYLSTGPAAECAVNWRVSN